MEFKLDIHTRVAPIVEVKADAAGLISGYASTFGGPPDAYGDVISPGAFKRTLGEHKAAGTQPALLWAHDMARPIGKILDLAEDRRGLRIEAALNKSTAAGKEALAHLSAGDVTGLSIGFLLKQFDRTKDGGRLLTDIDLFEVSAVAVPANGGARLTSVKSFANRSELEAALRDEWGLPRSAAKKLAAEGWKGLAGLEDEDRAEAEHKLAIADAVNAIRASTEYLKR